MNINVKDETSTSRGHIGIEDETSESLSDIDVPFCESLQNINARLKHQRHIETSRSPSARPSAYIRRDASLADDACPVVIIHQIVGLALHNNQNEEKE